MAEFDRIVICKQCKKPEYWGELRWLSGFCTCRNCYKAIWEDQNHRQYTWGDLDGPRPSQEDFEAQQRADKFDTESLELQIATGISKAVVDCYLVNGGNDQYICKTYNDGCKHQTECHKLYQYLKSTIK